MSSLILGNVIAYSLQMAALLAAGGLALRILRLDIPKWRLLCWQLLLAACLLLPALQPWTPANPDGRVTISTRDARVLAGSHPQAWSWRAMEDLALAALAAGCAIRLGMFTLGCLRLRGYRRRAMPSTVQAPLNIRAQIATSDEVPGPVTFGFFRPIVLLPARWADNESVLCHELIHVRRGDWLFMAAEELLRAVLWFHPLVWYAIAQIQLAREEVVDREVVNLTQSREQYLETLLAIAAARSGLDLAPAPLFLKKRHLRNRVASLLKEVRMSKVRLSTSLAGFLALTLAAGWVMVRAFPLQAASALEAAQDDSPKRIRIGGNVQAAKIKKKVTPVYPPAAKQAHIEGTVRMNVTIDRDGKVVDVQVVSGPAELTDSAVTAVQQWEYETTLLNGQPVEVLTQVDVNYTLTK
jgi:TonB family protein